MCPYFLLRMSARGPVPLPFGSGRWIMPVANCKSGCHSQSQVVARATVHCSLVRRAACASVTPEDYPFVHDAKQLIIADG